MWRTTTRLFSSVLASFATTHLKHSLALSSSGYRGACSPVHRVDA